MKPTRRRVAGVMGGALLLLLSHAAWAQEGERVVAVDVQGNRTVAAETILAKVQTKPGAPYQEPVISEDIRRIFSLGYFTDVRTDLARVAGGLRLTFVVTEKPTVEAIKIQGHRVLRTAKLLELLGVKEGQLYDARAVKEGVDRIKAEYGRGGFAQVEIHSRAEADEDRNSVTVYLLLGEGARMRMARILIEGNTTFSDRRIRRVLKTKRRRWLGLGRGVYDPQVVEEDVERIKAFYQQHGYQDVDVTHRVYEDPAGHGVLVHFTVAEGLQHRLGQVVVEGNVLFPEQEIRRVLALKPGAVYHREGLQEDLRQIKQYYGDRGYIHAEVTTDVELDPESKRVNLTYHIEENELVYLSRVDIQGNVRTKDIVVRRELRVYPGEPFDGAKVRKSIERLYNLGYFEEVNVETAPTDDPAREDLLVKVKEAKTGSFSFGGGFSSIDRLVGLIELEQRNFNWRNYPTFTGAGQDLKLRVQVGTVRRYFDLSFTEPWFFDRPVSFGVDLYSRTRLRSRSLGLAFEEERRGGGVRFGKEFADALKVGVEYQLFRTEISDVVNEASSDLKAERGRSDVSMGGLSASFDRRNNRFDPTDGFFLFSSADLAGGILAGDKEFWRLQGGASHYAPHADRFVFESRLRAGVINEYSDTPEVPIFERFFAGGADSIRGFRERRVGPRDTATNDPIGGETMLIGTVEEVMTIMADERSRPILKLSAFFDVGNVWRHVDDFATSFKSGTGIGARVNTPLGPVRLDVGVPVSGLGDEKRKPRFHFNISRSF